MGIKLFKTNNKFLLESFEILIKQTEIAPKTDLNNLPLPTFKTFLPKKIISKNCLIPFFTLYFTIKDKKCFQATLFSAF